MKTLTGCLILIILLISGCTFNIEVLSPAPIPPTSQPIQTVASPVPLSIATISATAEPTPTLVPTSTYPVFFNARMGASPDDPYAPTSFPARTKAVYAIWDYQNMRDGLMIRREWYWNGQPYIKREEAWDFGKYGANGTIRDVRIFDDETGLNSGIYQLRLYIDNVLQPIGPGSQTPINPWITFSIGSDDEYAGYASPDYKSAVEVFGGKRIILQTAGGISKNIFTAREVPYVSWFPDGRHFLFVDRDRSGQQIGTNLGIRDDLWMVEVPSGGLQMLYESDTSFAGRVGPQVSSDGRFIASLEGSGFGDACLVDSRLIFIELASDLRSMRVIRHSEFSGLPASNEGSIYPVEDGSWQSENTYLVTLDGTCNSDQSQLGPYMFDPVERTAELTASASINP